VKVKTMARPQHEPSEVTRTLVIGLASCGIQQTKIAAHIGVTEKILRARYRAELDFGLERAVAKAASNMFRLAQRQSMTGFYAARHVLNCKGGPTWRDVNRTELDVPIGGGGISGLLQRCGLEPMASPPASNRRTAC
jgi:hypothetical protein